MLIVREPSLDKSLKAFAKLDRVENLYQFITMIKDSIHTMSLDHASSDISKGTLLN